jgi:hypothetical protein
MPAAFTEARLPEDDVSSCVPDQQRQHEQDRRHEEERRARDDDVE